MSRWIAVCVCLLMALVACRNPVAVPTWNHQMMEASRQGLERAKLPPVDHESYAGGFSMGAAMIHAALEEHRVPFVPRPDAGTTETALRGNLPKGSALAVAPLQVEVDEATGLPFSLAFGTGDAAWKRGVLDGFAWSLEQARAVLEMRDILRPAPVLTPPPPEAWHPWPALLPEITLHGANGVRIKAWRTGILAWRCDTRGFAPQCSWHALTEALRFHHAAATEGLLWVATSEGFAVGMDVGTGLIRAIQPSVLAVPKHVKADPSWIKRWHEEMQAAVQEWQFDEATLARAAKKGDAFSQWCLGARRISTPTPESTSLILAAAGKGHPDACIAVALAYLEGGLGLPQDTQQAWAMLKFIATEHPPARQALDHFF